MDATSLVIQLVVGAVGGNLAGLLVSKLSLGFLGNTIVGILGGALGGQALGLLGIKAGPTGSIDLASIVASFAGGLLLLAIIGIIRSALRRST